MPHFPLDIFLIASTIGVASFALSGMLAGVRHHHDLLGVFIMAMLPAAGGGAIRDVLVGEIPKLLTDGTSFFIVAAVLAIAFIAGLHKKKDIEQGLLFVVSDAIGLVAFSITGALKGLEKGLTVFGVMILAFITAVGGGIMRDMLVNEVPLILKSEFYGSVALLVGLLMYLLHMAGYPHGLAILAIGAFGISIRLLAYFRDWHLPKL